ncbi:MAG: CBS domain-containing protein [Candidatus Omnitrophota bacterium]|jgi:CBS domain-containing protein/sporulation protein YlmC with PRC-barrel domain|nr:CBS domain-containing protein [Candidatus Omnitrophota bacterium]
MINANLEEAKIKAAAMFLNFSDLLGKDVLDSDRKFIGRLWDISAKTSEVYPKSDELIIFKGFIKRYYASVPFSNVSEVDQDVILNVKSEDVKFESAPKDYEFLLRRNILDQQVVDTFNHKVIRVNDIHLLKIGHELMVAHVDIGLRGLLRRLGWEHALKFIVKKDDIVSWKFIQPVAINPASMTMKLSVSQKQLQGIPAADLGEIMFDLNMNQRMALFRALDMKTKAKIFENLEFEDQEAILKELDKKEAASIVTNMSSDEATDLLSNLPRGTVENILTLMESDRAKKLSTLLGYSSDSAGGLMTTEFVSMPNTMVIEAAIDFIKNQTREFDTVPYIYVVDDKHKLQGVTTIRRLLFADLKDTVLRTVFPTTIYVHLHDSVKEVAFLMDKYKISAIPVVDENKLLHGIITMDDILNQLVAIAWRKRPRKTKGL